MTPNITGWKLALRAIATLSHSDVIVRVVVAFLSFFSPRTRWLKTAYEQDA